MMINCEQINNYGDFTRCFNQENICCCNCAACCTEHSLHVSYVTFTAVKRDRASGAALSGATYTVYRGGKPFTTATSDSTGAITFLNLPEGQYELAETVAPAGYTLNAARYRIGVNRGGGATINGEPAANFILYDDAAPVFSFIKTDSISSTPLSGAEFTLSNGATAVSDENGRVNFGAIAAGTYTLAETAAPTGYARYQTAYTVDVTDSGITVDGRPLSEFSSENTPLPAETAPTVNTVTEGDAAVTGEGTAGATIEVTFDGDTTASTEVSQGGTWTVTVPESVTLTAGQTVSVVQTRTEYRPSSAITTVVQPRS